MIEVFAQVTGKAGDADLSPFFPEGQLFARPTLGRGQHQLQVFVGLTYPSNLLKIASLDRVRSVVPIVLERNARPMPYPPDEERTLPQRGPGDWARLRTHAVELRRGSLPWDEAKAYNDGREIVRPMDWFEVMPEGPHKARAAWERGYEGEGVTVAVLDDGIDAAHADLIGTQRIYSSTLASHYNGWPMVFSPFSMLVAYIDSVFGTTYVSDGQPGIHYVDTSQTPSLTSEGGGVSSFSYTPLLDYTLPGTAHTYVISDTMTQGGAVRVGTHPDNDLRDYVWGEKVAVLVCDPNAPGVFDTVYVDLDNDYDFRDEKPLTGADPADPATYNDMVAYRDMSVPPDGIPDVSGGMLYFIADGATPIPVSDWMWGGIVPANGDMVAFSGGTFDGAYSHGTQCASNVVGQGVVNGLLPDFEDLAPGPGRATGAVFGMAPGARVVNVSDIYWDHDASTIDAYIFAAVGYDGLDQTDPSDSDAIQICSNSYGASDTDNDGWDYRGQVVSQIQRWYAPNLQFLFSTGNGAPGYGTAAPPSPATGISVGASTQFGSTGWDSITRTTQIMYNDVTPFSNRGPGARGTSGVDVVAGGAFAGGDEELNYISMSMWGMLDGNLAWSSWGGTSRSAPVAMGVLALIYEAYRDAHGVWPTHEQAKALLMSSATDLNFDTFAQGAGSANADRGTAVAGGHYGLHLGDASPAWQPGGYRGVDYPGFAHVAHPGDILTRTFALHNSGQMTVTAAVDDAELVLISSVELTYTVTADMVAAESAYGEENRDNFYKAFNYFIPLTATASARASWHNVTIPSDTDLMVVRQVFPYDQFDADGDYEWDNRFYLMVYNWLDVDGDGLVWDDKDSNGVVNFINSGAASQIDGGAELEWDDTRTELDRWEYGRFAYHRPGGNRNEVSVHDPLERMMDGLFIGLRHHPGSTYTDTTSISYRIDFYREEDVPWLTQNADRLEVAPGVSATLVVTAAVPQGMPAGDYEADIQIHDPGMPPSYAPDTLVVPVALDVAAIFTGSLELGGAEANAYDQDRPYNNGVVRGLFDWTWRGESGDWRFFFIDVPQGVFPPDTEMLARNQWDHAAPHTDIDTLILGPTASALGSGWYDEPEAAYYGPYVLDIVGGSPNSYAGSGTWRFDTSSGGNEDWVTAPITDGLHEILQHNVLFEGDGFETVFTQTLGTLQAVPNTFAITSTEDSGEVGTVSVQASLPLNGLVADGFGLGGPEYILSEPLGFVAPYVEEWHHTFTVTHGAKIELMTSSSDVSDIDLFLYYCGPTGSDPCELRGASTSASANEHIELVRPEDGGWIVGVDNWSGPAGHFDLTKIVVDGYDLGISGLPIGAVAADALVTFTVHFSREMPIGETFEGLLLYGPPEAPSMKQVPVTIERLMEVVTELYLPLITKG